MGNAEALVTSQQIDSSHSHWPSLFTVGQRHEATLLSWRRRTGVGSSRLGVGSGRANMQLWAGKATLQMWKKSERIKKKLQYSIVFNSMWLSQIKVWKKVLSLSKYSFFFSISSMKGPESRKCWNPDSTMLLQEHPNVKLQFNTNYMQDNDVFTGGSKVINTSFHFQASENRLSVIAENIFTFSQVLANPAQGILITMHPLKKQVECIVQSTSNHTHSPSSCCRFPHQIDLCDSREHRPHPFRE